MIWPGAPADDQGYRVPTERIGVFGGTFDPIHVGHLVAAVNARHAACLDRVLLVVANEPWQKAGRWMTPALDRLALVEAALEDVEGLEASDLEIARGGVSYTADTLSELHVLHPGAELALVVGADVAAQLATWERVDEVAARATLVVVNRPGIPRPSVGAPWRVVHAGMPAIDISSTELRARAGDGRPLEFLVPPAAIRCLRARGLYAGPVDAEQSGEGEGTAPAWRGEDA